MESYYNMNAKGRVNCGRQVYGNGYMHNPYQMSRGVICQNDCNPVKNMGCDTLCKPQREDKCNMPCNTVKKQDCCEKPCDKKRVDSCEMPCGNSMKYDKGKHSLVMAYVPWQKWGNLYAPDCALKQGTLFKDLDLDFCGVR